MKLMVTDHSYESPHCYILRLTA